MDLSLLWGSSYSNDARGHPRMPVDYPKAFKLLRRGYTVPVDCDYCGELVWSNNARWTGMRPYHPECEDKLAEKAFDELIEEIDDVGE